MGSCLGMCECDLYSGLGPRDFRYLKCIDKIVLQFQHEISTDITVKKYDKRLAHSRSSCED